jgi:hypothetical protein
MAIKKLNEVRGEYCNDSSAITEDMSVEFLTDANIGKYSVRVNTESCSYRVCNSTNLDEAAAAYKQEVLDLSKRV